MRALKEVLNVILDLPKEAIKALRNKLSPLNETEDEITSSTPAGAIFMGMELLDKMGLSKLIDEALGERHTPLSELRKNIGETEVNRVKPSAGTVLSLLVADMVAKPKEVTRMYKVEEIAKAWKLFEIYGIEENKLNDDRILRCMSKAGRTDCFLNQILLKLALEANEKFGVPLERFFLDSTITELDGEFQKAVKACIGRGSDLSKQLVTSMIASAGSKIPVGGFVYPGNTNDSTTLPDAIEVIKRIAEEDKSDTKELVMDRIYLTAKNILTMRNTLGVKIKWLSPLKSGLSEERFRKIVDEGYEKGLWKEIDYRSPKEISKKLNPSMKAFETTWIMTEKIKPELEKGQKRRAKGSIQEIEVESRCVVYKDENRAEDERKARDKRKEKIDEKLSEFEMKMNKRNLKGLKKCQEYVEKILKNNSDLKRCIVYSFEEEIVESNSNKKGDKEDVKKVIFNHCWNEELYEAESKYEGVFSLLTEFTKEEKNSSELIGVYRSRNEIEMNFRDLKGILELERVFLQEPERIDAYIYLKIIAYFVLAFLSWYLKEKHGIKMSEKAIQDTLGKINIVEGELSPTGITFCDITGDSELCKKLRNDLNITNPYKSIGYINQISIKNFEIWLSKWYENWLKEVKIITYNVNFT